MRASSYSNVPELTRREKPDAGTARLSPKRRRREPLFYRYRFKRQFYPLPIFNLPKPQSAIVTVQEPDAISTILTVLSHLEEASTVFMSAVVPGELIYGYKHGKKLEENLRFLDALLGKPRVRVLEVGAETSHIYADLRLELKGQGRPIPTNDLWIAAQAIESGAVLLTNDAHFNHLTGIRRAEF